MSTVNDVQMEDMQSNQDDDIVEIERKYILVEIIIKIAVLFV